MREADRNALALAQDRLVHRCTCGAWCWGSRPCTTCSHLYEIEETG